MKKNYLVLFSPLVLFSVVLSTLLVSTVLVILREKRSNEYQDSLSTYKLLQIDFNHNKTSEGFVTLPYFLKENEFVSYNDDGEGISYLISNFEDVEYKCFGTCYCESSSDRRRSTGTVISRGIMYLLVAASSIFAYNKAKEYFEEKCITEMTQSENCEISSIQSSVDDCSVVKTYRSHYEEKEYTDSDLDSLEGGRRYFCYGNCVQNWQLRDPEHIEKASKIDCQKLRQEAEILLTYSDLDFKWGSVRYPPGNIPTDKDYMEFAINIFIIRHMDDFCKRSGQQLFNEKENIELGSSSNTKESLHVSACMSTPLELRLRYRKSRCIQVEPPSIDKNSKEWMNWWRRKERWEENKK